MKLSELIGALEALRAKHGDCVVVIDDADTCWPLAIDAVGFEAGAGRVAIGGGYYSEESKAMRAQPHATIG